MNNHNHFLLTAVLIARRGHRRHRPGEADCKLKFTISGWSAFYKRSDGTGTITCTNGQSMRVRLRARGGGPTVGKSTIKNGNGEFSGVDNIRELLGSYVSAEAQAGAVKSAKGQVVTKGEVSLALVRHRRRLGGRRRLRQVHDPATLDRPASGLRLRDCPRQAVNSAPNRKICAE